MSIYSKNGLGSFIHVSHSHFKDSDSSLFFLLFRVLKFTFQFGQSISCHILRIFTLRVKLRLGQFHDLIIRF